MPKPKCFTFILISLCLLHRLLIQMEETQRTLDEFWNKHASHLKLCLQLRQFELDFRELQVNDAHRKHLLGGGCHNYSSLYMGW